MANVTVKGLRQLEHALDQLPDRVAKRLVTAATRAGATVIAKEAKRRVPVGTGGLRDSIVVKAVRSVMHVAGKGLRTAGMSRVVVGFLRPRSRIAGLVEFGTSRTRARPFMRPAMDETKTEVVKKIGESLARGIEREAKKLGRR